MKRPTSILVFLVLIVGVFNKPATADEKVGFPFYPSLINTRTNQPVESSMFENPDRCRTCHQGIYNQWSGSMHSNAFVDPLSQALWRVGEVETAGEIRNLCAGCHTPIGTVSEEVAFDPAEGRFTTGKIASRGVQCDFCHTVVESTWKDTPFYDVGNASLLIEPGNVKRGPFPDSLSPGHDTAFSKLHTSAEFCGSCHHVFHPVTNFPIERTYDEWRHSVYARAGIICQDCHMMPVEKAAKAAKTMTRPKNPGKASPLGPERENIFIHEFVGANASVTTILGAEKHSAVAEARLKSAAQVRVEAPQKARPKELFRFSVVATNIGAGHNLPTSLTEIREMWLDVTVRDEEGEIIFRSGALDEEGGIDSDANIFHAVAVDSEGNVTHKPWKVSHFESVRTIPPKGSDSSDYAFLMPEGLKKGVLTITAVLRYRSFSQHLADELLGEGALEVPVVDMASAQVAVAVSKK